ncbi:hypothetical protein [Bacteriophage sp.]|nr:hypothetical protein [Bacteriophage sp.]
MSRTDNTRRLEPLARCFVGLGNEEKRHCLSRYQHRIPTKGFSHFCSCHLFASVLRTILRTYAGGCAEGKPVSLTQGGRLPEVAKPRDKRVRSIDDDMERGTLKPYPINKALAPVKNWYSRKVEGLRLLLVITNHHLFRSPCIV